MAPYTPACELTDQHVDRPPHDPIVTWGRPGRLLAPAAAFLAGFAVAAAPFALIAAVLTWAAR